MCVCVCVCVKFCCKLGKNFTATFQLLDQADGEDCMSRTQCCEWCKRFKWGRMPVGEDLRPGRPSALPNGDHVEGICAVIRGNRRLTAREVADEMDSSIGSCHQIFTEKLPMRRVSENSFRVCWLTIRKRTVFKSARNCLPMQMVMKTFLRTS